MSFSDHSRRNFLKNTARAGIFLSAGSLVGSSMLESCSTSKKPASSSLFNTLYEQGSLPYAYNALEPFIDAETMEIHFSKHASLYQKNLKEAALAEGVNTSRPLEEVFGNVSKYSAKLRNNGGGHYNHELYWKCMKSKGEGNPAGALSLAIDQNFKSFADFKSQFADAGKNRFGSGWVWLISDPNKKLVIGSTPNQDNPLMDVAEVKGMPLLGLDVWEHAYYLKYQNKRADYIDGWWNIVNWDFIQKRYEAL